MKKISAVKVKKSKKWLIPVLLVGLVILSGISLFKKSQTYRIHITLPDGKVLLSEVADSEGEHLLGFYMAASLTPDLAVLFIYEKPGLQKIWSHNIQIPVDLIWLDKDRKVVQIDSGVMPCDKEPCPSYQTAKEVMFLLHVVSGAAREHGLEKGVTIEMGKVPLEPIDSPATEN